MAQREEAVEARETAAAKKEEDIVRVVVKGEAGEGREGEQPLKQPKEIHFLDRAWISSGSLHWS